MFPKLSIIIPFGTSEERNFIDKRVLWKINQFRKIDEVEVIFVEGFSSKENRALREEIKTAGFKYIKDKTQQIFSVGACRNLGVVNSTAPVFMFLDVDYYISNETLKRLLNLIQIKEIDKYPNRFICLPCAFLTEYGTKELIKLDANYWDAKVAYDLVSERKNIVKFLSITSSSIVMNRHKFLELGGNDLTYVGHGYEDFDFYFRLFNAACRMEIPPNNIEYDAKSWNFTEYKGFRALFSVPGYEACFYGLYLYHFWHPEPNNDGYLSTRKNNHNKFYNVIKSYKNQSDGPDPLILAENKTKKILAFVKENSKVYRALRGMRPYLGEFICANEEIFFDKNVFNTERLVSYLRDNQISYVLFPNSYGNELRLTIYKYLKDQNIPFINFDRGALPDSWFFDVNGFNWDSSSYSRKNWDRELNSNEIDRVERYIHNLINSDNYLEDQNKREGGEKLRQKLGLRNKKIIFVPGQVAYDTVIKYFSDELSYYDFFETLNVISPSLRAENIVLVAKVHPLMKDFNKKNYNNIVWVPDNTNINNILECCDKVITINSGVGLYSLIYGKPCATIGHAFYENEGLAIHCKNANDILKFIRSNTLPDKEKVQRFIYYLVFEFYCFGKSYYSIITNNQNETRKIVNYIDFYRINFNGQCLLDGVSADLFRYKKDTLAFRPYIGNSKQKVLQKPDSSDNQSKSPNDYPQNESNRNVVTTNDAKSTRNKKLKKLLKHPYLYFRDYISKRIKSA